MDMEQIFVQIANIQKKEQNNKNAIKTYTLTTSMMHHELINSDVVFPR